jgi:hypothetical protein
VSLSHSWRVVSYHLPVIRYRYPFYQRQYQPLRLFWLFEQRFFFGTICGTITENNGVKRQRFDGLNKKKKSNEPLDSLDFPVSSPSHLCHTSRG